MYTLMKYSEHLKVGKCCSNSTIKTPVDVLLPGKHLPVQSLPGKHLPVQNQS